ncbi:MAG: RNA methyltransferase [Myxococcota bacterium]
MVNKHTQQPFDNVLPRPIRGQKHPLFKRLKRLGTAQGRAEEGLFLVDGPQSMAWAIAYGAQPRGLLIVEGHPNAMPSEERASLWTAMGERNCPIWSLSAGLMGRLMPIKPTPTCVAIMARQPARLETVALSEGLVQLVENLVNPNNLGMLLRTAEATGVDAVVLAGQSADPWSRCVIRASRGALFRLPICLEPDVGQAIATAKQRGLQCIALETGASVSYTQVPAQGPILIVVGNERHGVSPEALAAADMTAHLPMMGELGSLNVSVAASIMLYEARRQRRMAGPDHPEVASQA